MTLDTQSADSTSQICTLFANHFASIFTDPLSNHNSILSGLAYTPANVLFIDSISASPLQVAKAIANLKLSFSPGPDGIPAAVLKKCSAAFVNPLALLFELSLSSGVVPAIWKSAWLTPIFKKGDRLCISNCRGVTLLCACSKVFEPIVLESLLFKCKSWISSQQHGFMPGLSTVTNLMNFISSTIDCLDHGLQLDAVYTDFSAAFDRVPHSLLLAKLLKLGFSTVLVDCIESFLLDRYYKVKIDSYFSSHFTSTSGVPQGSVLIPFLFLLYVNDTSTLLPASSHLMHADDLKIFLPIAGINDCLSLQFLLDSLSHWCLDNFLDLCDDKCSIISFSRSRQPILHNYFLNSSQPSRVHVIRDLGVTLDSKLSFNSHFKIILLEFCH